jgi:pseudoazurin
MKNINLLPLLIITFTFVLFFNGKKYDEMVTKRLSTNTAICLEGQSCGAATAPSSPSSMVESIEKVQLSQGSEHVVKMLNSGDGGQMIFEPAVLKVSLGDTVHFKATDMAHNSASMEGMIPEGAKKWAGVMNQDISVVLDTEGVYVYQCDPHVMMAMIGVIQVGEASNLSQIKGSVASTKSKFMLNSERLEDYLSRL